MIQNVNKPTLLYEEQPYFINKTKSFQLSKQSKNIKRIHNHPAKPTPLSNLCNIKFTPSPFECAEHNSFQRASNTRKSHGEAIMRQINPKSTAADVIRRFGRKGGDANHTTWVPDGELDMFPYACESSLTCGGGIEVECRMNERMQMGESFCFCLKNDCVDFDFGDLESKLSSCC